MKIGNKYYTRDKTYWYQIEKIQDDKVFCKTSTGYFLWVTKKELEVLNEE